MKPTWDTWPVFDHWTHDNENGGLARNFRVRFWRLQLVLSVLHHRYPNPASGDRFVVKCDVIYDCKRLGVGHVENGSEAA